MTKFTISGSFFEKKQKRIFRPLETIGFNKKISEGSKSSGDWSQWCWFREAALEACKGSLENLETHGVFYNMTC